MLTGYSVFKSMDTNTGTEQPCVSSIAFDRADCGPQSLKARDSRHDPRF